MTDRLISADALITTFIQKCTGECVGCPHKPHPDAFTPCGLIVSAPTVKAEPIKHGRWVWNKRLGEWYCSNCDRIMTPYTVEKSEGEYEMAQPFYCGWCGAKMDLTE